MLTDGLYDPFCDFVFPADACFLTGKKVDPSKESITVFPAWLMERYGLQEKPFTMLGEHAVKYGELRLPCAQNVILNGIAPLESEIQEAFTQGYAAVKQLDQRRLFQWMARLVYGILYNDLVYAIEQHTARQKTFKLSPYLTKRFQNLHAMLQSLVVPMRFEPVNPWSIAVVKVNYSKDIFNYKDETKNLNFSLAMHDFGIIACLQDNGENLRHHERLVTRIGNTALHAIQFEELWCHFLYSNYLMTSDHDYHYTKDGDAIVTHTVTTASRPVSFKPWEDKMFAQVLANYWKPWGLTMGDIYQFPNSPVSYLIDEYTNELIRAENIPLQS